MNKNCIGCGSRLQSLNISREGYVRENKLKTSQYCERCYKIMHYGEFSVLKEDIDFDNLIKKINEDEEASVVFLIDLLNVNLEAINYIKKFNNRVYILLTRRDLLPKSVKDKKLISYFKENYYDTDDIMIISSVKKYNVDAFLEKVRNDKVNKLYVAGLTNSGKSTFINALLGSIGKVPTVTTSALPNTTANFITIEFDENLTIVDTPGFVLENSIYNFLNFEEVNKLSPKKEIKVKTYQIKPGETIIVADMFRIDYLSNTKNSFSFYMNNNLEYTRMKAKNTDKLKALHKINLHMNSDEDIVINGVGFIKVVKPCDVHVYAMDERLISKRNKMI